MQINKVLQTPVLPCDPDNFYFVKDGDSVNCFLSNSTGTTLYKVFHSDNFPSVDGPKQVNNDGYGRYTITDYDELTEYIVTVSAGTIEESQIYGPSVYDFTPPIEPGPVELTVNGNVYVINVVIPEYNIAPTFMKTTGGILPLDLQYDIVQQIVSIYNIHKYNNEYITTGSTIFNDGSNKGLFVAKFNTDFTFDSVFGNTKYFDGYGHAGIFILENEFELSESFIQSDGKILILGRNSNLEINIIRLNSSGELDLTYGVNGSISHIIGTHINDQAPAVINNDYLDGGYLLSDNKLLATGRIFNGIDYDLVLIRFNTDGSLDTTFNTTGFNIVPVGPSYSSGSIVRVLPDGKYLVTGQNRQTDNSYYQPCIVKFNTDGTLDTTYGVNGKIFTIDGTYTYSYSDVLVLPNGSLIICGGGSSNDGEVYKLNPDGSIDNTFRYTFIGIDSYHYLSKIIKHPTNGFYFIGVTLDNSTNQQEILIIKLNDSAELDLTFNEVGYLTKNLYYNTSINKTAIVDNTDLVLICSDDKPYRPSIPTVIKYDLNGNLVSTFNPQQINSANNILYKYEERTVILSPDIEIYDAELAALNNGLGDYRGCRLFIKREGIADSSDMFDYYADISNFTGQVNKTTGAIEVIFDATSPISQSSINNALQLITYSLNSTHLLSSSFHNIEWTFSDGNQGSQGEGGELIATGLTRINYEVGILISEYCDGFNRMGIYTDGEGGTYSQLIEVNSTTCGYVPPFVMPTVNNIPYPTIFTNIPSVGGLSMDNLTATGIIGSEAITTNAQIVTGKWYWEITAELHPTYSVILTLAGVAIINTPINQGMGITGQWVWGDHRGSKYDNGVYDNVGIELWNSNTQVLGLALDMDTGNLEYYLDGVSTGIMSTGITGAVTPVIGNGTIIALAGVTANFGATPFAFTPPSGYIALNTP